MIKIIVSGKRKTAIARAVLTEGNGRVNINKKDHTTLPLFDKLRIEEPLRIADSMLGKRNYNVEITVLGGGAKGQIESARLALARALIEFSKSAELKKAFTEYDRNLLVADVRRKETYKPGDSKARRRRQKSYR